MSTFAWDDNGALARLATTFEAASVRAGAAAFKTTQHFTIVLQGRVKARAQGRPGPRVQTGDYNRSITARVGLADGGVEGRVGTNKVQGPRLEFGFHGTDSIGRTYDQPALPHFGPAFDETAPEYQAAIAAIGEGILDEDTLPAVPAVAPSGGREVAGYTRANGTRVAGYRRSR